MKSFSSFQKRSANKNIAVAGTKPSLSNNQLLISSGIPSLDNLLGASQMICSVKEFNIRLRLFWFLTIPHMRIEQNLYWRPLQILIWGNFDDRFSQISRPARVRSSSFFHTIYKSTLPIDTCHRFPAPTFGLGVGKNILTPIFSKMVKSTPKIFPPLGVSLGSLHGRQVSGVSNLGFGGGVPPKEKFFFSILRFFPSTIFLKFAQL